MTPDFDCSSRAQNWPKKNRLFHASKFSPRHDTKGDFRSPWTLLLCRLLLVSVSLMAPFFPSIFCKEFWMVRWIMPSWSLFYQNRSFIYPLIYLSESIDLSIPAKICIASIFVHTRRHTTQVMRRNSTASHPRNRCRMLVTATHQLIHCKPQKMWTSKTWGFTQIHTCFFSTQKSTSFANCSKIRFFFWPTFQASMVCSFVSFSGQGRLGSVCPPNRLMGSWVTGCSRAGSMVLMPPGGTSDLNRWICVDFIGSVETIGHNSSFKKYQKMCLVCSLKQFRSNHRLQSM